MGRLAAAARWLLSGALLGSCSGFFWGSLPASLAGPAAAAPDLEALLQAYRERRPAAAPALSPEEALRWQRRWLQARAALLGPPVGYKAALTSPAAQRRFGARGPVWGALFRPMLRPGPEAEVGLGEGARLLVEADLLVRVGDPGALAAARTREELAGALDAVLPFVELPDLLFAPGVPVDAALIAATGAGARLGVVGEPVPLRGSGAERAARLGAVRVMVRDGEGRLLGRGSADALLGHPLEAVRWLRDALAAEGIALERGQLLSLGTLARPVPAREGLVVRATYRGLDPTGPVTLTVHILP